MQIKQNKTKQNKNEKLRTKKRPSTKQGTFVTLKMDFVC